MALHFTVYADRCNSTISFKITMQIENCKDGQWKIIYYSHVSISFASRDIMLSLLLK